MEEAWIWASNTSNAFQCIQGCPKWGSESDYFTLWSAWRIIHIWEYISESDYFTLLFYSLSEFILNPGLAPCMEEAFSVVVVFLLAFSVGLILNYFESRVPPYASKWVPSRYRVWFWASNASKWAWERLFYSWTTLSLNLFWIPGSPPSQKRGCDLTISIQNSKWHPNESQMSPVPV